MAEDPLNQQAFAEDVAAAAAAGGENGFAVPPGQESGGAGFQMPSPEDIWKLVEQMEDISDAEREELRESIFNPKAPTAEDYMRQLAQPGHSSREYLVFMVMIALIVLVFALFGYKLYKSLTEKQIKKQEKLKSKQQKKAKKSN
ncbi:uncharacterized protein LOC115625491 isoform X1 [Scaptodrosophila lebanonensis]|uniref:Uncharacterized protein LOC115625491 isoform X1 n=1 Tax=Drosophila lebanonensis TaxID=7225 RepID=A0A6J2TLN0_DROLE|nr:uncharacterized protein LOC115625491 isoform X1 [Scaptodrosophila lebanonensis]XP_030376415.1 uncharacterized protein LOC115625491 isoform X1 [Scaptodrosophila lebanonensis]XP_030376422.1 uncharacterized protein LOC115625491 isoform X1 [Scaptodrosophila lebanonensis]XP_030376431.1 uncharacterized protein LOC115625491 isoform X1 [Scaptodrosophila lebanonensis]